MYSLAMSQRVGAPSTPRGRPRDATAKQAVLDAALSLVEFEGITALSIESIAARSGVSKPTIYRWWTNKAAIVLEALHDVTAASARYPDSGDITTDLRQHCRQYARLLAGPHGNAYRALFAEAQRDPSVAASLRDMLIAPRRQQTRIVLQRAIERGQIKEAIDIEAAIDQLYAPFLYRLLLGHAPLTPRAADTLVAQALGGLRP